MKISKKIISFVVAITMMVCCLIVPCTTTEAATEGTYDYAYECKVVELVNQYRTQAGLEPLVMDTYLLNTAMVRAKEITVLFSHTRPDGTDCFTAFPDHFYGMSGENIAMGYKSPEAVVEAWMNSPGHRANIMDSDFVSIGVGCYTYNGRLYWVQSFSSMEATPVQGTWMSSNGRWWYQNPDGSYPTNTWQLIDNEWYYFDAEGWMVTGWEYIGGRWYYMNPSGTMATGWLYDGGVWYYLHSNGIMATGWLNDGGTWYYMYDSGAMATGWLNLGGTWYYLNSDGSMVTGWLNLGGTWFYLYSSGAMASNTVIDGCALDSNGAWVQ